MANVRQSNIELLRIVAMFFIVSFHLVYKSGFEFSELNTVSLGIKSMWMLGELGVNLFVLVTGYFLVSGRTRIEKIISFVMQVLFYFLLTFFISCMLGLYSLPNLKDTFLLLFPIILNKYWYATAYILVYLLSPWLNRFLRDIEKTSLFKLLMMLMLLYCVIPTIFGVFRGNTESFLFYTRFLWLLIMYMCGAYIRMHGFPILTSKGKGLGCFVISYALAIAAIVIISSNAEFFHYLGLTEWAYFWTPNSILTVLMTFGLFRFFLGINIKPNKLINTIASTTFGIYLLHDSPYLQTWLWREAVDAVAWMGTGRLLLYMIAVSIVIFILCSLVDILRQQLERFSLGILFASNQWTQFKISITKRFNACINQIVGGGSSQ